MNDRAASRHWERHRLVCHSVGSAEAGLACMQHDYGRPLLFRAVPTGHQGRWRANCAGSPCRVIAAAAADSAGNMRFSDVASSGVRLFLLLTALGRPSDADSTAGNAFSSSPLFSLRSSSSWGGWKEVCAKRQAAWGLGRAISHLGKVHLEAKSASPPQGKVGGGLRLFGRRRGSSMIIGLSIDHMN